MSDEQLDEVCFVLWCEISPLDLLIYILVEALQGRFDRRNRLLVKVAKLCVHGCLLRVKLLAKLLNLGRHSLCLLEPFLSKPSLKDLQPRFIDCIDQNFLQLRAFVLLVDQVRNLAAGFDLILLRLNLHLGYDVCVMRLDALDIVLNLPSLLV